MRAPGISLLSAAVAVALFIGVPADGAPRVDSPHPPGKPYFEKYCLDCHDDTTKKGGLDLEALPVDFSNPKILRTWTDVFDRISGGEMPPKKKPRPEQEATDALLAGLKKNLIAADLARRGAEGRVVLRRLNRVEYENTMRDLLGVDLELKELLPEDTSSMGFDNIGEALNVSSVLMERYLEAADAALDAAIVKGPRPETKKWNVAMGPVTTIPEKDYRLKVGAVYLPDESFVYYNAGDTPILCDRFRAPLGGKYRFKITASAYRSAGRTLTMAVLSGFGKGQPQAHTVGYFDLPPDKVSTIEFTDTLSFRSTIKIAAHGLGTRDLRSPEQVAAYTGPGVAVQRVEVEGPIVEAWPPTSTTRLFGDLDFKKATLADAEKVLRVFASRAFRRPVTDSEVAPYVALVKAQLDAKQPFEQAVRAGLKGILCSLDFLFLKERVGKLNDSEVASRLSYFLWSTAPDDELLRAASQHSLTQPAVLRAQVGRMLNSPRAHAFTENFTGQWLLLRQIDFTTPDKKLYPEFDPLLQDSMVKETHAFFEELLKTDASLLNFIHSDFAMLNGRLAEHYGIASVTGQAFRKVKLPPGSHRGGVLTQAAVLKVTANGTNTSPVVRGAWFLRNIIGRPPKAPPPDVPAIEPDIRGAKTIRDQLDRHRSVESCAICHMVMDPPGLALENFDVIGGWRENYRSLGEGTPVKHEPGVKGVAYKIGLPVDAADELPDGRKFKDIDEFKKLVLADKEQVARCLTEKLLVYSTGGALGFSDREVVADILTKLRAKNYGFRTLIHEVVESRTFLTK